jgi:hypothetical protein
MRTWPSSHRRRWGRPERVGRRPRQARARRRTPSACPPSWRVCKLGRRWIVGCGWCCESHWEAPLINWKGVGIGRCQGTGPVGFVCLALTPTCSFTSSSLCPNAWWCQRMCGAAQNPLLQINSLCRQSWNRQVHYFLHVIPTTYYGCQAH